MRKSEIKEIELYLKKKMQLFEENTLTKLQESTVKKALSIITDVNNIDHYSLSVAEALLKIEDILDSSRTEEEVLIALDKISREDERIYFNVPNTAKKLAKFANCCYDSEKKLWFTYSNNDLLSVLVDYYSVNESTSEKAMKLLKAKTEIQ